MLNKIKRIDEWWIRRNTIQLPDNYIHVEGNLSTGLRMDAYAEGYATQRMGQKTIQNNEKHCINNVLKGSRRK